MLSKFTGLLILFLSIIAEAQQLSGTVIDAKTKEPIEMVVVYFDGTTVGTTTNSKGKFVINYSEAIKSPLIISYLGYNKIIIEDYREKTQIQVALEEALYILEEVVINYDDGLTRKQKLIMFRREFLGTSDFAKSCKILNEEDLILRYSKNNQRLTASAKAPLQIINKALKYRITYELIDFEVIYRHANIQTNDFVMYAVTFYGTSFFENLDKKNRRRVRKLRDKAYHGSKLHFMRSLYQRRLNEEGYSVFFDKFRVNEWDYFSLEPMANESAIKKVQLKEKVAILYKKEQQSLMFLEIPEFYVDAYGNYNPIKGVYFSGALGYQRAGDMLPSNYGL